MDTHMSFITLKNSILARVLNRPENEKPFLLIPVGFAAVECWVPDLKRKTLDEMTVWYEWTGELHTRVSDMD